MWHKLESGLRAISPVTDAKFTAHSKPHILIKALFGLSFLLAFSYP